MMIYQTEEMRKTIIETNALRPRRGILESLYLVDNKTKKSKIFFYNLALAIYHEGGACCGGQVCTWCLEGIPTYEEMHYIDNKIKSSSSQRSGPTYKALRDKSTEPHHITGRLERCRCTMEIKVNSDGDGNNNSNNRKEQKVHYLSRITRENYSGSQSLFFINPHMNKVRILIAKKIMDRDVKCVMGIISSFMKYLDGLYEKIKINEPNRFKRLVFYDSDLTFRGHSCSLCRRRRVDTVTNTFFHGQPAVTPSQDITNIKQQYDHLCCYDCIYQLNNSLQAKISPSMTELIDMLSSSPSTSQMRERD